MTKIHRKLARPRLGIRLGLPAATVQPGPRGNAGIPFQLQNKPGGPLSQLSSPTVPSFQAGANRGQGADRPRLLTLGVRDRAEKAPQSPSQSCLGASEQVLGQPHLKGLGNPSLQGWACSLAAHQPPGNVIPWVEKAEAQERASGLPQGDQQTVPERDGKSALSAPHRSSFQDQPCQGSDLTP